MHPLWVLVTQSIYGFFQVIPVKDSLCILTVKMLPCVSLAVPALLMFIPSELTTMVASPVRGVAISMSKLTSALQEY